MDAAAPWGIALCALGGSVCDGKLPVTVELTVCVNAERKKSSWIILETPTEEKVINKLDTVHMSLTCNCL